MQAVICRDSSGQILIAKSSLGPPCDPNTREALVAFIVAQMAASLKLQSFIMEGDSQVVVLAINNSDLTIDWQITPIISDIITTFQKSSQKSKLLHLSFGTLGPARLHSESIPITPQPRLSFHLDSGKDHPQFQLVSFFPGCLYSYLQLKKKRFNQEDHLLLQYVQQSGQIHSN